jgi:hypothetical protein
MGVMGTKQDGEDGMPHGIWTIHALHRQAEETKKGNKETNRNADEVTVTPVNPFKDMDPADRAETEGPL